MIEMESPTKDHGPPRPKALCALWSGSHIAEHGAYFALGEDKAVVMEIDGTQVSKWLDKFRGL